jgi:hypothetical protein
MSAIGGEPDAGPRLPRPPLVTQSGRFTVASYGVSTYRMMLWFWTFATNSSVRDKSRRSKGDGFA